MPITVQRSRLHEGNICTGFWNNTILDADEVKRLRSKPPPLLSNRLLLVNHAIEPRNKWDVFESNFFLRMMEHLIPQVGSSVREVHLNYSSVLDDQLLAVLLIHCPNLSILNVRQANITERAFSGLSDYNACRQLRAIDLSDCAAIRDSTITSLAECWTRSSLRSDERRVDNCVHVMDVDGNAYTPDALQNMDTFKEAFYKVQTVPRKVPLRDVHFVDECDVAGVHKLSLNGCTLLTDETLSTLMHVQTVIDNIAFLDLSGCFHLSGGAISDFVRVCPLLKPMGLYYCDHVVLGPYNGHANGCSNLEGHNCCVVPSF